MCFLIYYKRDHTNFLLEAKQENTGLFCAVRNLHSKWFKSVQYSSWFIIACYNFTQWIISVSVWWYRFSPLHYPNLTTASIPPIQITALEEEQRFNFHQVNKMNGNSIIMAVFECKQVKSSKVNKISHQFIYFTLLFVCIMKYTATFDFAF